MNYKDEVKYLIHGRAEHIHGFIILIIKYFNLKKIIQGQNIIGSHFIDSHISNRTLASAGYAHQSLKASHTF